jgi:hypothetical protein
MFSLPSQCHEGRDAIMVGLYSRPDHKQASMRLDEPRRSNFCPQTHEVRDACSNGMLGPYAAVRRRARGEASCPGLEPFCGNSRALSDFRTLARSID